MIKIAILLCFSLKSFCQIDTIEDSFFKIHFDFKKKQPVYIEFTYPCNTGQKCPTRKNKYTSYKNITFDIYKNNGYDRGHMIPYSAVCCNDSMISKVSKLYNFCFQTPKLNRGRWEVVESYEKKLALKNKVKVIIIPIFSDKKNIDGSAHIPIGFKRTIIINDTTYQYFEFKN